MKKKSIVILDDRSTILDQQINLGDRAHLAGIRQILHEEGYKIVSTAWKSFPYLTIKKFRKEDSPEDIRRILEKWVEKVTHFSPWRAAFEEKIIRAIEKSFLLQNGFSKYVDHKVRAHYTRGIFETIKPYVFRQYYARETVEAIKQADIVICNGAGLIADHLKKYLPLILFQCYLAKSLGKKVALINQSIALEDALTSRLASVVYPLIDVHTTREPISADVLRQWRVPAERIISSCDAAFASTKDDRNTGVSEEKVKAIPEGSIALIIRGDRPVDYSMWAEVVHHLINNIRRKVFLVSTCKAHDQHIYKELSKRCQVDQLLNEYDHHDLITMLKRFDAVITDRYHAAIFSIQAHTPVVPLDSTTIKMKGLFTLFPYPIETIKPKKSAEIITVIESCLQKKSAIKKTFAEASMSLRERVRKDIKNAIAMMDNKT